MKKALRIGAALGASFAKPAVTLMRLFNSASQTSTRHEAVATAVALKMKNRSF